MKKLTIKNAQIGEGCYLNNLCVDERVGRQVELDLVVRSLPLPSGSHEIHLGSAHAEKEPAIRRTRSSHEDALPVVGHFEERLEVGTVQNRRVHVEERNLARAKQFADFVLKVNKISIKRRMILTVLQKKIGVI